MNKLLTRIFQVYVFAYSFFFAARPISDGDFWFHLKTGEYIIRTGSIPRTELFSFTHQGIPWVAHGWLSGVSFYAISSWFGLYSLIVIFALLTAAAFWIVFKRCESHPFIAGFATLLAVWTVLPNIGVRPRVFTILLGSVYLALLSRFARQGQGRAIWFLVPLMALWANLHGGFLIGLALIGLTMVGIVLDSWAAGDNLRTAWRRLRTLGLVLLGSVLAGLLNPYGVQLYVLPIRVLRSPVFQNLVVDWLSPNFHQSQTRPLLILILLSIAAFALSPKRIRPSELLLFVATLYATLTTQRNAAIFALVAAPLFAHYFQNWLDSTSFGKSFGQSRSPAGRRFSILMGIALLLPLAAFVVKLRSTVFGPPRQESFKVPLKAVAHLKERQIVGNTFIAPNIWGGYLIWALPSNPVYYDGRDVYPEKFVEEFVDIIRGKVDWRGPFERHGVQIVLIEPKTLLARLLEESGEWERVYEDEMSVIFKRQ